MKHFLICFGAGLVAASTLTNCTKEPLTAIEPPLSAMTALKTDPALVFSNPVHKDLLLDMINAIRTKGCRCGTDSMPPVDPLVWNIKLEQAAWLHSKEMYDSSYMSHTGKNGSSAADRIRKTGYNLKTYKENLALGVLTEKTVLKGWMGSETHCRAMMDPHLKETAVARYANFWTQELAVQK